MASAAVLAMGVLVSGCEDDSAKPNLLPQSSALAESKSDSARAEIWTVDAASKATFKMEGKTETITGHVGNAKGKLEVDLSDLTKSAGNVQLDLFTLTTTTFDDEARDKKQTLDAHTWLEVADRIADKAKQDTNKWAEFSIVSIDKAEPKTVSKEKPAAKITAQGKLRLHGRVSEHTVELDVAFEFEGDKPKKMTIKSSKPMKIELARHGVEPRDPVGKLIAGGFNKVLRDKVAEQSNASFEFTATATGQLATAKTDAAKTDAAKTDAAKTDAVKTDDKK